MRRARKLRGEPRRTATGEQLPWRLFVAAVWEGSRFLPAQFGDDLPHGSDLPPENPGPQCRFSILAQCDRNVGAEIAQSQLRQERGISMQRFRRERESRKDRAAAKCSVRADPVHGRGGAGIDDNRRAVDWTENIRRDRVQQAIETDLLRQFDLDRHGKIGPRVQHERLGLTAFAKA